VVDVLAALTRSKSEKRLSLSDVAPLFGFDGHMYPYQLQQTLHGNREEIRGNFAGYVNGAYRSNGIVFAIELIRMSVFADARFAFRSLENGRPGDLFWNRNLNVLRHPWPNATTGDLLTRAIVDVDLAGNHFAVRSDSQIRRLRPDWVSILLGSDRPNIDAVDDPDAEVLGYLYHPGGDKSSDPITYLPEEVAHWAPIPDPIANFRGMSWLTPVLRDIETDKQSTVHKQKFLENGATPNMIVTFDAEQSVEKMQKYIAVFNENHQGATNAYKTLFMGGGASADVVGKDFRQLDFKAVQGAGETRIAAAGGIHPTVIGLSEGLQGASLNAGNYAAARRSTADRTFRPLWRSLCGSYETLVTPPRNAELWVDLDGVAFLREDQKDAAEIMAIKATTIATLVREGFTAESVVRYVTADNAKLLEHTGALSVQLVGPAAQPDPLPDPEEVDNE
jgi:hypothetical protein